MDTPKENHKKKSEDSPPGDIVRNETASMANADGSPDSKEGEDTIILDDPDYTPPNQFDILLSDIDSKPFMATSRRIYVPITCLCCRQTNKPSGSTKVA